MTLRKPIIISEYYDLFEFNKSALNITSEDINHYNTAQNAAITPTNQTNPFIGFWNNNNFNAGNPNNNVVIAGKAFSPQAYNNVYIEDDGTINCFPPNVSVPHWTKIIFRNFDYNFSNAPIGDYAGPVNRIANKPFTYEFPPTTYYNLHNKYAPIPSNLWGQDNDDGSIDNRSWLQQDFSELYGFNYTGSFYDYNNCPLFLKYDEYPSRSKVIFSNCDKTRNPDIEFNFNNQHNQNEPIKLYLSLSASNSGYDTNAGHRFNTKLSKRDIEDLLNNCYFCVEWIYNPETGN